jgi:hypothetical protein
VHVAASAIKLLSVVLIKITGFLPNLIIFELFAGKSETRPAFTELTSGVADLGGFR